MHKISGSFTGRLDFRWSDNLQFINPRQHMMHKLFNWEQELLICEHRKVRPPITPAGLRHWSSSWELDEQSEQYSVKVSSHTLLQTVRWILTRLTAKKQEAAKNTPKKGSRPILQRFHQKVRGFLLSFHWKETKNEASCVADLDQGYSLLFCKKIWLMWCLPEHRAKCSGLIL